MSTETADLAPPTPVARIVGGPERFRTVPLTWPVEFDGKVYNEIGIRRLTAAEVAAFIEKMRAAPDAEIRWPLHDCPDAVIDDDDAFAMNRAVQDFLPARFRGSRETGPVQATGDGSAPSS